MHNNRDRHPRRKILEPAYYKEQLQAKEDMLARTTRYLLDAQLLLNKKNTELKEINNDILDSIKFAELIQRSLLPDVELLRAFVKDAAYLVKQQMGIGGDAVFIKKTSQGLMFGLLDSTGHGIPAAMLSISGLLMLSEIILSSEAGNPMALVELLNKQLNSTFNYERSIAHMEGSVFFYSAGLRHLLYCSAKGKALLIPLAGEITELQRTKHPIGESTLSEYENTRLDFEPGDRLLLYSDGVTDQFGGKNNKKFSKARLKQLVLNNKGKSIDELKTIIDNELTNWRGINQQTDDISFMLIEL